jgi:membrane-associated phospholipid phosphatase
MDKIRGITLLRNLYHKYGHFLYGLVFIAINMVFNRLEQTVVPKYYMETWLDNYIPFVKVFVIPYVVWFIYIVAVPVYFGFTSRKDFMQLCTFMAVGQAICMLIYYLFPNGQSLRPTITDNDVFSRMIQVIYDNDTSTNVAPSIHVLHALAIHIGLMNYPPFRKKRLLPVVSFLVMVSVVLSTVFIKQHAIMDVFYGLLLSGVLYVLIYKYIPWEKDVSTQDAVLHN